jgi:predicted transcriptional regulator
MRARGMTHQEIAHELQVSRTAITSDIQYLRSQAKESIKEYVTEHLPERYQVCLTALDEVIKRAACNGVIQGYTFGKAGVTVKCYYNR